MANTIATDTTVAGPERANQLTQQVVQPLREVGTVIARYRASTPAVREANATAMAMLQRTAHGYELLAAALRANDQATLNDAVRELGAASDLVARWVRQVDGLKSR